MLSARKPNTPATNTAAMNTIINALRCRANFTIPFIGSVVLGGAIDEERAAGHDPLSGTQPRTHLHGAIGHGAGLDLAQLERLVCGVGDPHPRLIAFEDDGVLRDDDRLCYVR